MAGLDFRSFTKIDDQYMLEYKRQGSGIMLWVSIIGRKIIGSLKVDEDS